MGLFRKKVPPMWFVMDQPKVEKPSKREGPYNRETFVQLLAEGRIESTQLVWTSERIFPDATRPRSAKLVRIPEWRRLDEFPDITLRQLQAEGAQVLAKQGPSSSSTPTNTAHEQQPQPPQQGYDQGPALPTQ